MKKISEIFNSGISKVLKQSFSLYFRNIFRFAEIGAWIFLPASIFFVLIFYLGFSEDLRYTLVEVSFWATWILLLFLTLVVLKAIRAADEGREVRTLSLYAESVSSFFSYLRALFLSTFWILIWFVPFMLVVILIFKLRGWSIFDWIETSMETTSFLIVPISMTICYYTFSSMAFVIEGKKGMDAFRYNRQLIRPQLGRLIGYLFLTALLMQPVYELIGWGIDAVQSMPLAAVNLLPLLFYNALLNFFAVTGLIFFVVLIYFFYKKLANLPVRDNLCQNESK